MKKGLFFITSICLSFLLILSACSSDPAVTNPPPEITHGGIILSTTDAGATWQTYRIQSLGGYFASIEGISSFGSSLSTLSIISTDGYSPFLMKSVNSGVSWYATKNVFMDGYYTDITDTKTDGKGYALKTSSGNTYLLKTTDNGESWSEMPLSYYDHRQAIDFGNEQTGMMISYYLNDSLLITTDGGGNWQHRAPISATGMSYAIKFVNTSASSSEAVICGSSGKIFRTSNTGSSWDSVTSPTSDTLLSIDFIDPVGIIAGYHGTILRTEDGGYYWHAVSSGTTEKLNKVYCEGSFYWAIGHNVVLRSTDQGATWVTVRTASNERYKDLIFYKNAGIIVGGTDY